MKEILKRYQANPILKPADMPFNCVAVYNGGAIKINDEYILLVRAEDNAKFQYVYAARSRDGYHFTPDPEPLTFVADDTEKYQKYTADSFYDPRINVVDGRILITYAAYTFKYGCRIGIAETTDFKTARHISFPHHISNRNAVIFPQKFDNMYVMLHRPEAYDNGSIWISRSPDLQFWGDCEVVADRNSYRWDAHKIGAGTPPVKTERGWLVLTHAVTTSCAGHYYTMGAILLDLDNPFILRGRTKGCILYPEKPYECCGFVPNVVFPCGMIVEPDNRVKVYYGSADNFECMAESTIDEILAAIVDVK